MVNNMSSPHATPRHARRASYHFNASFTPAPICLKIVLRHCLFQHLRHTFIVIMRPTITYAKSLCAVHARHAVIFHFNGAVIHYLPLFTPNTISSAISNSDVTNIFAPLCSTRHFDAAIRRHVPNMPTCAVYAAEIIIMSFATYAGLCRCAIGAYMPPRQPITKTYVIYYLLRGSCACATLIRSYAIVTQPAWSSPPRSFMPATFTRNTTPRHHVNWSSPFRNSHVITLLFRAHHHTTSPIV